jgi:hypothetical protein
VAQAENDVERPFVCSSIAENSAVRDDRILPETRLVALLIPPFLLAAFILLYLFPYNTDTMFAWTIVPATTALLIGAAYTSGSYFFVRLLVGGKWHWFTHGLPAITVFTWCMATATFLHLDRFHQGFISFYAWVGLYVITPFLVPALWLRNRRTDPGTPDAVDAVVPRPVRWFTGFMGAAQLVLAFVMFAVPGDFLNTWPWQLTPLTARILAGWFALVSVMWIGVAGDSRWSAWRILVQSLLLAFVLMLIAIVRGWGDINPANPFTWVFNLGLAGVALYAVLLYYFMERRRLSMSCGADLLRTPGRIERRAFRSDLPNSGGPAGPEPISPPRRRRSAPCR